MCDEKAMKKIVEITLQHYRQKAVMYYVLSTECYIVNAACYICQGGQAHCGSCDCCQWKKE